MNEHIANSGAWGLALIITVIASWFLYHYLAPKTWKEWASAGVVQAFIIALYAEMYGFPLTIYLLVRFFGFDQTHLSANLWSTLLGMGETGMMIAMILGYALLFIGIGIFMEAGASCTAPARKIGSLRTAFTPWCVTRNTPGSSLRFSARASSIGQRSSRSCYFLSSFSSTFYWRAARNAKWRRNSARHIANIGSACRCSFRVGGNGASWPRREVTPPKVS